MVSLQCLGPRPEIISAMISFIHPVFTLTSAFLSTSMIPTARGHSVHACLSMCVCVCAHLSEHYGCMHTYVCTACACICQSPGVLAQLLEFARAHECYVSLRSTKGPLRKKRPGAHTHSRPSLKRSRARFAQPPSPHAEQHPP